MPSRNLEETLPIGYRFLYFGLILFYEVYFSFHRRDICSKQRGCDTLGKSMFVFPGGGGRGFMGGFFVKIDLLMRFFGISVFKDVIFQKLSRFMDR